MFTWNCIKNALMKIGNWGEIKSFFEVPTFIADNVYLPSQKGPNYSGKIKTKNWASVKLPDTLLDHVIHHFTCVIACGSFWSRHHTERQAEELSCLKGVELHCKNLTLVQTKGCQSSVFFNWQKNGKFSGPEDVVCSISVRFVFVSYCSR